jgi:hypothetical protein
MLTQHGIECTPFLRPEYDDGHHRDIVTYTLAGFRDATLFDISTAKDLIRERPQDALYELERDFLYRLPYPTIWMEWQFGPVGNTFPAAALVTEEPVRDRYRITITPAYMIDDPDNVSILDYQLQFHVDTRGTVYPGSIIHLLPPNEEGGNPHHQLARELSDAQITVGMALTLINCRNVATTAGKPIPLRRSGSQRRRGVRPEIRYNVIVLPGNATESDGKGGARITAMHKVRGHFKTFTADKPLMGKHVGTYWWGWQVRGSADHGVVISDYELGHNDNDASSDAMG